MYEWKVCVWEIWDQQTPAIQLNTKQRDWNGPNSAAERRTVHTGSTSRCVKAIGAAVMIDMQQKTSLHIYSYPPLWLPKSRAKKRLCKGKINVTILYHTLSIALYSFDSLLHGVVTGSCVTPSTSQPGLEHSRGWWETKHVTDSRVA